MGYRFVFDLVLHYFLAEKGFSLEFVHRFSLSIVFIVVKAIPRGYQIVFWLQTCFKIFRFIGQRKTMDKLERLLILLTWRRLKRCVYIKLFPDIIETISGKGKNDHRCCTTQLTVGVLGTHYRGCRVNLVDLIPDRNTPRLAAGLLPTIVAGVLPCADNHDHGCHNGLWWGLHSHLGPAILILWCPNAPLGNRRVAGLLACCSSGRARAGFR